MSLVGTRRKIKSNRIERLEGLQLPKDFLWGSITVNKNWQASPTGSINIENIREDEIEEFRKAYDNIGKEIPISKTLTMVITGYAETHDSMFASGLGTFISSYLISVNLEGIHETNLNKPIKYFDGCGLTGIKNQKIKLTALAAKAGLKYKGFDYTIELPDNTNSDTTTSFKSEIDTYLGIERCFLDLNSNEIRTPGIEDGSEHKFFDDDILWAVESTQQKPIKFDGTKLEGENNFQKDTDKEDSNEFIESIIGEEYYLEEPKELTLIQSDKDPTSPPIGVGTIVTLDLNFDKSGPRKVWRSVTTQNNQPVKEIVKTYGFAYLGSDIYNPLCESLSAPISTPSYLMTNPLQYWVQIEEQVTEYIYKQADINLRIDVTTDSNCEGTFGTRITSGVDGSRTDYLLPVYYVQTKVSPFPTSFDNKYLTEIVTTGWKLQRLLQEDPANSDQNTVTVKKYLDNPVSSEEDADIDAEYFPLVWNALQFRKIPFTSRKIYQIKPEEFYYDNVSGVPFRTVVAKRNQLFPSKYKDLNLNPNDSSYLVNKALFEEGNEQVIAAIPDHNYVYPMMVWKEQTYTQSFFTLPNPKNVLIKAERIQISSEEGLTPEEREVGLRETIFEPPLITGEDSYEEIERQVLKSKTTNKSNIGKDNKQEFDIYVEYKVQASSQDADYKNSLQNATFQQIAGRLPNASVFQKNYKTKGQDDKDNASSNENNKKPKNYYLTSSEKSTSYGIISEYVNNFEIEKDTSCKQRCYPLSDRSISFPTKDLSKAKLAALDFLKTENFLQVHDIRLNLAWAYFNINPGDFVNIPSIIRNASPTLVRSKKIRVKSLSYTIDFQGLVDGKPLITCDGTSVNCGIWNDLLKVSTTELLQNKESSDLDLNNEVDSYVKAEDLETSITVTIRTRRDFYGQ